MEGEGLPNAKGYPKRDESRLGTQSCVGDPEQQRYVEAATLLLSDDVPSLLTKPEGPLAQVEQATQEELALIEGHLVSGQYELAKSRLQVQRRILSSLSGHGVPTALLARVEAQIERVAHLEAQEEQRGLQRTCADLVAQVEQFCTVVDWGQARKAWADLSDRLERFRTSLSSQRDAEVIGLLEELAARSRQHLHELERYYLHQALSTLRSQPDAWEQVQGDLVQALTVRS